MGQQILTVVQKNALKFLASDHLVSTEFVFSGGTALTAYHLHHRLSEDLDFFSQKEIDTLWLAALAKRLKLTIGAKTVDMQQSYNRNLVFFPLRHGALKTEFTYFPFPPVEQPIAKDGLRIDSLLDIAVNKLFTIYQQPAARHFIDLYCILKHAPITWDQLKKLARIKFDVVIDPIQLGSQLLMAKSVGQLPALVIALPEKEWRGFFLQKAKELKKDISS